MSTETGFFRGEGGAIFEMDLPLPEHAARQLADGQLVRVTNDAGDPTPTTGSDVDAADGPPADSAVKAFWVAWAASCGLPEAEAAAMTKAQLMERYGRGAE